MFEDFVDVYMEYMEQLRLFEDWIRIGRLMGIDDSIINVVRDKYVEPYRVKARKILRRYGCDFRDRLFWCGDVLLEYSDWEAVYYRIRKNHRVEELGRFMNVDLKTALELLYIKRR